MMQVRYVEMYGLCQWEGALRRRFCLGYDPYFYSPGTREGIAADNARQLLQQLGVFYYRDDQNSKGILLTPTAGAEASRLSGMDMVFNPALTAYFFNVKVIYPAIAPVDYETPIKVTQAARFIEYKEKWGDTKHWLHWNDEVKVVRVTPGVVRRAITDKQKGQVRWQEKIF